MFANLAGDILRQVGELESAQQQFEWALAALTASGDHSAELEGDIRNNLGLALQARGDLDVARREYMHSLSLCHTADSLDRAYTLDNLGSVELDLGLACSTTYTADNLRAGQTLRLALDHFEAVQQIFRRLPHAADYTQRFSLDGPTSARKHPV